MTKTLTSVQSVEEKNIGVVFTALLNPQMGNCIKTSQALPRGAQSEDESQGMCCSHGKLPSLRKTPFSQA